MFGYPLTFAGSSVVQNETLFVFVRCVTNNKRPLSVAKICQNLSRHLASQQTELNRRNERELAMPCKNNGA